MPMQGRGKLYDGDAFICYGRYDIDAQKIQDERDAGRMSVTGELSGMDSRRRDPD
jgi:hypothetical protein